MRYLTQDETDLLKKNNLQSIKEENNKRLFNLIHHNSDVSRATLVRMTNLSPTTVS